MKAVKGENLHRAQLECAASCHHEMFAITPKDQIADLVMVELLYGRLSCSFVF